MQVVILAGGRGSRMGNLTEALPKPMLSVAGKPILEHQVELARRYGLTELIVLTGYLGDRIERHFGDGSNWGVSIRYCREESPLGTAGAIKEVEGWLRETFLVFYGDTIMDIDLKRLADAHARHDPLATLLVHPNSHPYDSDLVELDREQRIVAFHRKPHPTDRYFHNCANAAMYVMSPRLLTWLSRGQYADLGQDVFPSLVKKGQVLRGYHTPEYIKDVGTLFRMREVEQDVVSGKVARLNRSRRRNAIFLDRDGVLNADCDPTVTVETLRLLPNVGEAVARINRSEYLAVLVTNQPAVAKGWIGVTELEYVHAKLETLLGQHNAYLDRIYYCPHHPEKGFPGEVPEYKVHCTCRKPAPGMLLQSAADMNIDLAGSWMIGDRSIDVEAGKRAGCRTALIQTSENRTTGKPDDQPDRVFRNLQDAVSYVLGDHFSEDSR